MIQRAVGIGITALQNRQQLQRGLLSAPAHAVAPVAPVAKAPAPVDVPGRIAATEFAIESGFYKDKGKWLAVNPEKDKSGEASIVFPYRDGTYDVTLEMVGENDGQSSYFVKVEQKDLGKAVAPPSKETYEEGTGFHQTWKNVRIGDGDIIRVNGFIASADGKEWSRARWAGIRFTPVDGGAPLAAAT